ncbi:sensor histidine kinase KdpD [Opitutus sp. ER46]|uniref:sensor histidine kinase n=1 Tax=Opitutus sp. ER46 TaxID=2161864 RepID=UPI000D2F7764|nr:sensor histidine kinase KdpD [Opitutus sp. ER46]PTX92283.1 two-component sensor histidine kinase [Opitutus sp. ER46]
MTSAARPSADALLASLQARETRAKRGRLKVFLGMCPGVGKTHAMLRDAQQQRAAGTEVLVGLVETHDRAETAALLAGLEVLPRRVIEYRGTHLAELDLEAVRTREPKLVVVDELAHTNAPGARHAKRWQDVVELLDAGIDVLTTLNIQHVESRADAVAEITGAIQRETVPDSILDRADELELVDLTPEGLLERLREGKVYLGERATAAAQGFFQESHLAALRELALRYTAERVDRQLRELRAGRWRQTVWRSGERLLVAVGASPFSTQLVRWTRRLAAAQGAAWVAVHVETNTWLDPAEQRLLDRNLALARELGAEMVVTQDQDIPSALVRTAIQHNATQIVIGKPRTRRWRDFWRGTLVDRLLRLGGNIDIYVVPAEKRAPAARFTSFDREVRSSAGEYLLVAAVLAAITLGGALLPGDYYLATGLVYLLATLLLSIRAGRGPVFAAGVLSALAWNFLFIPPRFTFRIGKVEDGLLFGTYFVVALVAGQLTARIRAQAAAERRREGRAVALFQLTRALAAARTLDEAVFAALRQADELFGARTALLLGPSPQMLQPHFAGSFALDERERGVAEWVLQHRRSAGRFTDTLPSVTGFYLPLVREDHALGVFGIVVPREADLSLAQRDLLEAFARQLALSVEQDQLREAGEREQLLAESEKLHRVLLDSVSHELRTPLAVITGSLENLADAPAELRRALVSEARGAAQRLNRVVRNLLDQTRLESGALRPRFDWCDARDIINAALDSVHDELTGHPVDVEVSAELPPVRADFALMEQSLGNLLLNSARHTPDGTPVHITAGLAEGGQRVFFKVADRGPGLPPALRPHLFHKFPRRDSARAGGLGLGLSLVRGFVVAQGGEVSAGDNPGGGAVFTIYLPHREPQSRGSE